MDKIDKDDCAVYAIAFCCNVKPDDARYWLWRCGRNLFDGTTDRQISRAIRKLGFNQRRIKTPCKTIRGFGRLMKPGAYLILTCDHAVAVVDGRICDKVKNSDLMRIEKVYKITRKPFDSAS